MLPLQPASLRPATMRECTATINAFIRGGTPGLQRLKEVLPTIFKHYGVRHKRQQAEILIACKLMPRSAKTHVSFVFETGENSAV
jgi:hypothetical protein